MDEIDSDNAEDTPGDTREVEVTVSSPLLTLKEAAEAAGVSERTIQRRLDKGIFPNATKDESFTPARWAIPWSDLHAAGSIPDTSPADKAAPSDDTPDNAAGEGYDIAAVSPDDMGHDSLLASLRQEIVDLRVDLAASQASLTAMERTLDISEESRRSSARQMEMLLERTPELPVGPSALPAADESDVIDLRDSAPKGEAAPPEPKGLLARFFRE